MNQNASVNVRVTKKVKARAQKVLSELGLTMSEAVNLYLRQIALRGGIPFDIRLPNPETVSAMQDVQQRRNLQTVSDMDALQQELDD